MKAGHVRADYEEFDLTDKDSCPLVSWPTGHPAPDYVPNCDEVNVCGTGVTGGVFLRIMQNEELCYSLASASAVLEQMDPMKGSIMLRRRRALPPTPGCAHDFLQRFGSGGILKFVSSDTLHCWILSKCS